MRAESTIRLDKPATPSFWLRLAKGGALVLVGALAHLWLPAAVPREDNAPTIDLERDQQNPQEAFSVEEAFAMEMEPTDAGAAPDDQVIVRRPPQPEAAELDSEAATEPRPVPASTVARSRARSSSATALVPVGTSGVTAPRAAPDRSVPVRNDAKTSSAASRNAEDEPARTSGRGLAELDTVSGPPSALPVTLTKTTFVRHAPAVVATPLAALPPASAAPAVVLPGPEERIERVLQAYRTAFEQLDAAAAASVWPTVDVRALGYAFSQLSEQRVLFESCGISVSGDAASARCRGQAEYLPKVGGRRTLVTSGEWVFDLARRETDWQIVAANVK